MTNVQEKQYLRIEIDNSQFTDVSDDESIMVTDGSDMLTAVEFDVISPVDLSDPRRVEIYSNLADVDSRLEIIEQRVTELNTEIDRLTNHADGLDYMVAVASGILTGLIDSIFVGEFSLERGQQWGGEKIDNFVKKVAKSQGYQGDSLSGAVQRLEERFPLAADKATNDFGGGRQHHLRDFSHHPTPVGLFFSILTQFTGNVYGTSVSGGFQSIQLKEDGLKLIGKNFPEKIMLGTINWFFHMVSDMAGSSTSIAKGAAGTGLPGPIVSLLKEVSALPIFRNKNSDGYKKFSVWISKLFNGTLLGKRDANGKIVEPLKFDLRAELGVAHELGRQAMPVILNECIVRGFYFIRRFFQELKDKQIEQFSELKDIDWKKVLPFKNRTIVRMMTIATGTFTAVDLIDAAIRAAAKSGGNIPAMIGQFLLRVNFVGVGRFVVAIASDVKMGIKKGKLETEKIRLQGEALQLLNAKLFYKEADMWIEAENTEKAIEKTYVVMVGSFQAFAENWNQIQTSLENISEPVIVDIRENNGDDFVDELADLLEWGV